MKKEIWIKTEIDIKGKNKEFCGNCPYVVESVVGDDDYEVFYNCELFKKPLFKIEGKIYRCPQCLKAEREK